MDLLKTLEAVKENPDPSIDAHGWEQFQRSLYWRDIKAEIEAMMIETWELLEGSDQFMTIQLQGRIRALREFLMLPEQLKNFMESKANDTERKQSDE